MAAVAVLFVSLCGYPNWHGGWSLGSRYLLPGVFFAALPIAWALETPLSRGLFLAAAVFSVAGHALLTASWVHFPLEIPWPAATGSAWFLARGWVAPNLGTLLGAGPALSLLVPAALTAFAVWQTARAAVPTRPSVALAALIGIAPLAVLCCGRPRSPFFGRLWRAGVLGAYSGRDDARQELGAVVLEASTPGEKSARVPGVAVARAAYSALTSNTLQRGNPAVAAADRALRVEEQPELRERRDGHARQLRAPRRRSRRGATASWRSRRARGRRPPAERSTAALPTYDA